MQNRFVQARRRAAGLCDRRDVRTIIAGIVRPL